MGKYYIALMLIIGSLFVPIAARADEVQQQVIFSEISMSSETSASQEYIEIFNNTDSEINLSGWSVQYASAASTDWTKPTRTIHLVGSVQSKDYYLVASTDFVGGTPQLTYSATLAQAGGHLRIMNGATTHDIVGWGTAAMPVGTAVPAPPSGISLIRKTDALQQFVPTTNNATDYIVNLPQAVPEEANNSEEDTPDPENTPEIAPEDVTAPQQVTDFVNIEISEILPNPAAPNSDSTSEYVELYNPTSQAVNLTGYRLTAGLNETYKHTFDEVYIGPTQYYVLYSSQSSLTLSNTSGLVKLYAPDDTLIDQTGTYEKAAEGQAWIFADGYWQWTTQATPAAANILIQPVTAAKKSASDTKKATKNTKPKTKKASSSKKTASTKTKRTSATTTDSGANGDTQTAEQSSGIHTSVLAAVAGLAVLYACYEYRHDLANRIRQFRSNRAARRAARHTH